MSFGLSANHLSLVKNSLISDHSSLAVWYSVEEIAKEDGVIRKVHFASAMRPVVFVLSFIEGPFIIQRQQFARLTSFILFLIFEFP